MTDTRGPSAERLNGWKEISAHFRKAPRTVQRWEKDLGLPVHRIRTAVGGEILYAVRSELDAWLIAVEQQKGPAALADGDEPARDLAGSRAGAAPQGLVAFWRRPRHRVVVLSVVALALVGTGFVLWSLSDSGSGGDTASRASAGRGNPGSGAPAMAESEAPWPSAAHDSRQSNQGDHNGPAAPGAARFVFEAPRLLGFYGAVESDDDILAVTALGEIIMGWAGEVVAITPAGQRSWSAALVHPFGEVGPTGFAVGSGMACFGVHYVNAPRVFRTYVRCVSPRTGGDSWTREQFAPSQAPSFGRDGTLYQIDEVAALRAYALTGENKWTTVLAGYSMGAVAIDSQGNLYVGTDGGNYNRSSVWSVAPDGKIRWEREPAGTFWTPVISPDDRVYVASLEGTLLALDTAGEELWRLQSLPRPLGRFPLALDAGGALYYRHVGGLLSFDRNGKARWSFKTAGPAVFEAGAVLDRQGCVYFSAPGNVISLTPDGTVRWTVPLKDPGRIVIGGEGVLYVVSEHRKIFAIEDPRK